LGKERK
jgi:hypothetical protein